MAYQSEILALKTSGECTTTYHHHHHHQRGFIKNVLSEGLDQDDGNRSSYLVHCVHDDDES